MVSDQRLLPSCPVKHAFRQSRLSSRTRGGWPPLGWPAPPPKSTQQPPGSHPLSRLLTPLTHAPRLEGCYWGGRRTAYPSHGTPTKPPPQPGGTSLLTLCATPSYPSSALRFRFHWRLPTYYRTSLQTTTPTLR